MSALLASDEMISVEDYLEGEKTSELRHEFIDGVIYAMGGASRPHNLISNALAFALTPAARRKSCQLFVADMKVGLDFSGQKVFYYPDLMLCCDAADQDMYYCTRPCMIIEVLSPSTERVDRREKRWSYQTMPSLLEYVLVAQDRPRVEVYRQNNNWQGEVITSGEFYLQCLDLKVSLREIYQDIEFPPLEIIYPQW